MHALGQLTATLAHDINNQLAIVIGSLDMLELKLGAAGAMDADALRRIHIAQKASVRCAGLAHRLMAISDDEGPTP